MTFVCKSISFSHTIPQIDKKCMQCDIKKIRMRYVHVFKTTSFQISGYDQLKIYSLVVMIGSEQIRKDTFVYSLIRIFIISVIWKEKSPCGIFSHIANSYICSITSALCACHSLTSTYNVSSRRHD